MPRRRRVTRRRSRLVRRRSAGAVAWRPGALVVRRRRRGIEAGRLGSPAGKRSRRWLGPRGFRRRRFGRRFVGRGEVPLSGGCRPARVDCGSSKGGHPRVCGELMGRPALRTVAGAGVALAGVVAAGLGGGVPRGTGLARVLGRFSRSGPGRRLRIVPPLPRGSVSGPGAGSGPRWRVTGPAAAIGESLRRRA